MPEVGGGDVQEVLSHEVSLGAIGSSLPSRLDSLRRGPVSEAPRAAHSSSELLELENSLLKLTSMTTIPHQLRHTGPRHIYPPAHPNPLEDPLNFHPKPKAARNLSHRPLRNAFSGSEAPSSVGLDPADNANLLGNIMAWFHDMNPQNVAQVPPSSSSSTSTGTAMPPPGLHTSLPTLTPDSPLTEPQFQVWPEEGSGAESCRYKPLSGVEGGEVSATRPTQLHLVGLDTLGLPPSPPLRVDNMDSETSVSHPSYSHSDPPKFDSDPDQPSSSSSEWEGQVHLV